METNKLLIDTALNRAVKDDSFSRLVEEATSYNKRLR